MVAHSPETRRAALKAAAASGNVAETCRTFGIDRTTFYKLRARVEGLPDDQWLEALTDLPRRWQTHGQQTTSKQRAAIMRVALGHPSWGAAAVSQALASKGIARSANTVYKILTAEGLATQADRWRRLDQRGVNLSAEQVEFVEAFNPSYRDRDERGRRPAAIVHVGTANLGSLPGHGTLFLYMAVDTYSSYALGVVVSQRSEALAVQMLERNVLGRLRKRLGGRIGKIIVPDDRDYGSAYRDRLGDARTAWEEHGDGQGSGFVERFASLAVRDFMRGEASSMIYELKDLRDEFAAWRKNYNDTPLAGFPNYGRSPKAMLAEATGRA